MKSPADARRRMESLARGMGIHPTWIASRVRRPARLLDARRSIVVAMRREGYSLRLIGMAVGGRHHATILTMLRHAEKT